MRANIIGDGREAHEWSIIRRQDHRSTNGLMIIIFMVSLLYFRTMVFVVSSIAGDAKLVLLPGQLEFTIRSISCSHTTARSNNDFIRENF